MSIFNFSNEEVTNMQRAIVRFRQDGNLIPIGAFLTTMEIIADDKVGTACTDCVRKITYSPKYFENLSVDQCVAALIHESNHKFLAFFQRFERWAPKHEHAHPRGHLLRVFNWAQDYTINYMIKHNWKLPLGNGWLYDPKYRPEQMSTEQIADELLEAGALPPPPNNPLPPEGDGEGEGDPDDTPPEGESGPDEEGDGDDSVPGGDDAGEDGEEDSEGDGGSASGDGDDQEAGNGGSENGGDIGEGDDIQLPDEYKGDINNRLSEEDMKEIEMGNRQDIAEALRAAKAYGDGREGTDPFTSNASAAAFEPSLDFRSELMKHANQAHNRGPRTWMRPSRRRRTKQGVGFPTPRGKRLGLSFLIIDSSGSTDGPPVRYCLDEVSSALKQLDYERTVIIWCSDEVAHVQEFTKEEVEGKPQLFDGRIYRRGYGTNFHPAFEYIAEHYPNQHISCITYLTDGGTGEVDVEMCAEICKKQLRNPPVLWLLMEDHAWDFVARFRKWVKEHKAGRCTNLPMEEVKKRYGT